MLARADDGRRVLQLSEFYLDKLLCETVREQPKSSQLAKG